MIRVSIFVNRLVSSIHMIVCLFERVSQITDFSNKFMLGSLINKKIAEYNSVLNRFVTLL